MNWQKKSTKISIAFILLLFVGGFLLMYKGNDAVAMALKKKEGIVTAEQVKVSFNSVNGRLIKEAVKEAQQVKKGEVLMVLDSTDTDLAIAKLKAQIGQLEAQIRSGSGNVNIGLSKTNTDETQSLRQVDQQRAAVAAAQASYENSRLDYQRKQALLTQGAISKSDMDNASMALKVANANVAQQEQLLAKLLGGAADTGDSEKLSLPTIEQERQTVENQKNDVEALRQQKKYLEVQLQELQVQKDRLTLRAPEDGKVLKILSKQGEMIAANTPVILLESRRYYYDIYLSEKQAAKLKEGGRLTGTTVATDAKLTGTIRFITKAPGFADLKMSREKGQSDLSAFQVRIYLEPQEGLLPGMTMEVHDDQFA